MSASNENTSEAFDTSLNSIKKGGKKDAQKDLEARVPSTPKKAPLWRRLANQINQTDEIVVPVEVTQKYLKVKDAYVDRNSHAVAFTVAGDAVTAKDAQPGTVSAMVEIAKANQWESITVSGTDEFKAAVWMAARTQGLEVYGYKPSPVEEARLAEVIELQAGKPKDITQDAGAMARGPERQANVTSVKEMGQASRAPAAKEAPIDVASKPSPTVSAAQTKVDVSAVNGLTIRALQAGMKAKGWPADKIKEFGQMAKQKFAGKDTPLPKVKTAQARSQPAHQRSAPAQQKAPAARSR